MSLLARFTANLKIGVRIYAGFAVVLMLLLTLAVVGYGSLIGVRGTFKQYGAISDHVVRVTEVDRDIISLQRNLREYIRTNDKNLVASLYETGKHAREILADLAAVSAAAEQQEQAKRLLSLLDAFSKNFDTIVKIQADLTKALNDVMNPLAVKLSAQLAEIIQSAIDDADMSGAAEAGIAQQQLMRARLSVADFLSNNDARLVEASERDFSTLAEGLKRLNEVTNDDARAAKVAAVTKETPGFLAAFRMAVKLIAERGQLIDDVNAKLVLEMTKTMAEMKTAQADSLDTLKQTADANISSTLSFSIGLAGLALALGVVFAWFIGRGVTVPILSLSETMDLLASGNLDVEVPGADRGDELGRMAKSVLTFREAGRTNIRLQQEAVEKDRQAAAASAAAMAKVMEELDAALGNIVKAAAVGNFSERVELAGKSGLVLKMGTAINSLCENVANALNDLVRMLSAMAEGDLTPRITAEYQGAFATLKNDVNTMADRLSATITDVKASASEVTNASSEISTSATDLSQRTEEQAASLEETSASMEQISATVKKNAENAQAANQSAADTREVADRGGEVVAKAVQAMARIEESSRNISDIITVIDEIARQTNLLALNAAVEAARAGDAGRGFAVVATEVRSLAQRSSQAAKDIKDLITNSNDQVNEGVELVNQAGVALSEIVESIKAMVGIVSEIAAASAEQASGIEQVNKALTQMDEVTQQNSALVEENAAAAKTLEHQAKAMDEHVALFKLAADAETVHSAPEGMVSAGAAPSRGPAAAKPQAIVPPKRPAVKAASGGLVNRT